jgi:hypothetical protein
MVKYTKGKRLVIGLLLTVVASLVLLSSIMALDKMLSNQSATSKQASSPNNLNNGLTNAAPITFEFVESNFADLTVAAGSEVQGTIPIKINGTFSFIFWLDDRGFNTTESTLPEGISVSINMYGKTYRAESVTSLFKKYSTLLPAVQVDQSPIPPVSTALGETTIQYTVTAASSVPTGVYDVKIVFQCVTNDGELAGFEKGSWRSSYGAAFKVILHVQ